MIRWFASGAMALGCLGIWTQQSAVQDPNSSNQRPAATSPVAPAAPVDAIQGFGQAALLYGGLPDTYSVQTVNGQDVMIYRQQLNQYQEAIGKYRNAKVGSEERDAARAEIAKLLAEKYDGYMQQHEQQIADLEERLAKLKDQLQRRREAKSRMVELKLEMVLSQADGLGWPEGGGEAWLSPFFGQAAPVAPLATPSFPSAASGVLDVNTTSAARYAPGLTPPAKLGGETFGGGPASASSTAPASGGK